jgi:hypothetical protein
MTPQQTPSGAELISLCYNILETACPANVTQAAGLGSMAYHIIDMSDYTPILSACRTSYIFTSPRLHEYSIQLYEQTLPLSSTDAETLYHNISAAFSAIISKKYRAEEQERQKEDLCKLNQKILKAQEYLKHAQNTQNEN